MVSLHLTTSPARRWRRRRLTPSATNSGMYKPRHFFAMAIVLLSFGLYVAQCGQILVGLVLLALPGLLAGCLGVTQTLTAWRLADEEERAERRRILSDTNRHMWIAR